MARNGSGTYVAPSSSWNPAINNTLATSGDWQALLNDIVAALTQSLSRDGQGPMTGNLQMGGNKITGQGAADGTGQALIYEQLFNQGTEQDIASAATTDIGAQLTNFLRITGTTTITSFGTNYKGPRFLRFAGAVLLTNSSTLSLPGGGNITTAAGDSLIVVPKATLGTADGWQVIAYQKFSGGVPITSGTSTVALTNVNVTLTTEQTAYPVITFTGTLTGNVIVTFPTNIKSYRIQNNTSGAFTVTCKTASGTGAIAPSGASSIFCDGTNIVSDSASISSGTAVSASGTSVDFTSIPAGVKRVTVVFSGLSSSGTSQKLIQIGSGSVTNTGYVSTGSVIQSSQGIDSSSSTAGFIIQSNQAADALNGSMVICLISGNTYVSNHTIGDVLGTYINTFVGGGTVTLGGAVDRVRITTVNGTDTFDAGTVNILWE